MPDSRQGLPLLVESLLVRGMVANEISTLPEAASAALRDLQQNDGKISLAEWEEAHKKMFKDMDKNADGFLTDDEMKKGPMGPPPEKK